MKKLPILIVLIAFFAAQLTSAQRPTDQGKILIGLSSNSFSANLTGSNNLFSAGITNSTVNSSTGFNDNYSSSNFSCSPKAGYFVAKNVVMGAELSMSSTSARKDPDYKKNRIGMGMIGPFIRYYSEQNTWFYPIIECGYSIGSIKYIYDYKDPQEDDEKIKYKLSNIYGSAGMAFVLSDYFMIDAKINANYFIIDYPKNRSINNQKDQSLSFQIGLTGAF